MFEYILTYFEYPDPKQSAEVVRDIVSLTGVTLLAIVAFCGKGIIKAIKAKYANDIRRYCGEYHGYRWAADIVQYRSNDIDRRLLVEVKVAIRFRWKSLRYVLTWYAPNGSRPTDLALSMRGRELVAHFDGNDRDYFSLVALHTTTAEKPTYLSGAYLFLNKDHEMVSSCLTLSRNRLDEQEVAERMPFAYVGSDQGVASSNERYFLNAKFKG